MKTRVALSIAVLASTLAFASCAKDSATPKQSEPAPTPMSQSQPATMPMNSGTMHSGPMQPGPMPMVEGHEANGTIHMVGAWARAVPEGQQTSGAYITFHNVGTNDDALIKAESSVANTVEIHEITMNEGMMEMHQVPKIDLKAGELTVLKPGGFHIMLIGLKQGLEDGQKIDLTLTFEKAGTKSLQIPVRQASRPPMDHSQMHKMHHTEEGTPMNPGMQNNMPMQQPMHQNAPMQQPMHQDGPMQNGAPMHQPMHNSGM